MQRLKRKPDSFLKKCFMTQDHLEYKRVGLFRRRELGNGFTR